MVTPHGCHHHLEASPRPEGACGDDRQAYRALGAPAHGGSGRAARGSRGTHAGVSPGSARRGSCHRADGCSVSRGRRPWLDRAPGARQEEYPTQAVAEVVYSANALANLERAFEFLAERDPAAAIAAAKAIRTAVSMLAAHPLVGRRVHGEVRELV